MRRMFSEAISVDAGPTRGAADALDAYLKSPVVANVSDPLEYWNARLGSPSDAPLARFALDFLSIPGKPEHLYCDLHDLYANTVCTATSTDAERAFSRGRLTVSRLRHSLADASVRANTVLGSWARIPGLVSESDLINNIKGIGGNPPGPGHDGQGAASSSKPAAVKKTGTSSTRTASASTAGTSGTSGTVKKASTSKLQSASKTSSKATKKDAKGKSRADPEVFELDSDSE